MANIFRVSYILQLERIAKYEKRGNYLPILHEVMCDDYFIITFLLKSNMTRVSLLICLLHWACWIQCNTNLVQTRRSENCKFILPISGLWTLPIYIFKHSTTLYFDTLNQNFCTLFVLYSMVFCNYFFLERSVSIRMFDFSKSLITLKTRTY